jgi:cytochrome c oxidase subunit II
MTTMLVLKRVAALAAAMVAGFAIGDVAWAGMGQPSPWQLGFQNSVTPVMDYINWFHDWLLVIITLISLFVLALLVLVIVKFNAKANPTPSRTTHNTLLEVAWTLVPVIVLVVIAVPSFKLLFMQTVIPPSDVTIKATGKQWYWTYAYPDSNFEFDSLMLKDNERKADQPRLLAVDNEIVVPVNKNIRVQVIGADVIHAFGLRCAVIRHHHRRGAGPPQRNLVQGDPRGHLLRPVPGALRQGSRLHADRGARRERARLRRVAGTGQE